MSPSSTSSFPAESNVWLQCMDRLSAELPMEDVHTWLKPLQARVQDDALYLFAPNTFILEEVRDRHLPRIRELAPHFGQISTVELQIGSLPSTSPRSTVVSEPSQTATTSDPLPFDSHLDDYFHFENFVEGRSNQMARAAAILAAQNPGAREHNPLLLYGATGLGKTHLMLAAGNEIRRLNRKKRVLYLRSNEFYNEFISALKENRIDRFKRQFQKIDTLLIDDIQFFAGKDRTQEEFFHTFNMMVDGRQQLILTSDRYPRDVEGLEPRLKSRLNSGLSIAIDPPDFETRALIVLAKARERGADVPEQVATMIAKRMHSNVRELEGALNSLVARANLMGQPITMEFAEDSLRDLFRSQQKTNSVPNIQKVVADYYSLPLRTMLSDSKKRTIARARQMAMALSRELTGRSLPELGEAYGRDHSTVLNACKVITKLRESDATVSEDWNKLMRKLAE